MRRNCWSARKIAEEARGDGEGGRANRIEMLGRLDRVGRAEDGIELLEGSALFK